MFARSTTITATPEKIDTGIAFVRNEVLPMLDGTEGCVGLSLLVDRDSGRCIATSSWATEEAMRASSDGIIAVRDRAGMVFGGTPAIQEWQIVVVHRDHRSTHGARVRATWLRADPADLDQAVDVFKTMVLPALEQLAGFCSASLMVDRATGLGVGSFSWDSLETLQGSREAAMGIRAVAADAMSAAVLDVREFELAIAHLRVPELV